jgi:hypothetical protein
LGNAAHELSAVQAAVYNISDHLLMHKKTGRCFQRPVFIVSAQSPTAAGGAIPVEVVRRNNRARLVEVK